MFDRGIFGMTLSSTVAMILLIMELWGYLTIDTFGIEKSTNFSLAKSWRLLCVLYNSEKCYCAVAILRYLW